MPFETTFPLYADKQHGAFSAAGDAGAIVLDRSASLLLCARVVLARPDEMGDIRNAVLVAWGIGEEFS